MIIAPSRSPRYGPTKGLFYILFPLGAEKLRRSREMGYQPPDKIKNLLALRFCGYSRELIFSLLLSLPHLSEVFPSGIWRELIDFGGEAGSNTDDPQKSRHRLGVDFDNNNIGERKHESDRDSRARKRLLINRIQAKVWKQEFLVLTLDLQEGIFQKQSEISRHKRRIENMTIR